jgi:hypothetical protein
MDLCDFCSSPAVIKRFECRDFDSASKDAGVIYPETAAATGPTNLVFASKGYWAACAPCAALVEAGDVEGLVKRVLDEFEPLRHRAELESHLRRTYKLFLENQIVKEESGL